MERQGIRMMLDTITQSRKVKRDDAWWDISDSKFSMRVKENIFKGKRNLYVFRSKHREAAYLKLPNFLRLFYYLILFKHFAPLPMMRCFSKSIVFQNLQLNFGKKSLNAFSQKSITSTKLRASAKT